MSLRPRKPEKCLNPNCGGSPVMGRGLCNACYHCARRLVRQGHTTWSKLEAEGRSLPRLTGSDKRREHFGAGPRPWPTRHPYPGPRPSGEE